MQGLTEAPDDGNMVNFSMLNQLNCKFSAKNFGIMYVQQGMEHYAINNKPYEVKTGQYLLINPTCSGNITIDSKTTVKGLCIEVSPSIITDVANTMMCPNLLDGESNFHSSLYTTDFLEGRFNTDNRLGLCIQELAEQFAYKPYHHYEPTKEFFYSIAQNLVFDHQKFQGQLSSISAAKTITKKELYHRLMIGKELMDATYTQKLVVAQVAQTAGLSEYYFMNVFRSVFGLSPYQYLLHKRLALGKQQLKQSSVSEVAIQCGFADVFAFSKAFKKHYGIPPSKYQQKCELAGIDK